MVATKHNLNCHFTAEKNMQFWNILNELDIRFYNSDWHGK